MIKNIVSCGCSWMYGSGCYYPEDSRVSALLDNKYDAEDINMSKDGGNNDRSVRKIVTWAIENKDKLDETIFILGLTRPERYEIWDEEKGWYGGGSYYLKRTEKERSNPKLRFLSGKTEKLMAKYHFNTLREYDRTLRNVLYLMGFLDLLNCKYLIFDSIACMRPNFDGWEDYMEDRWVSHYKGAPADSRMLYLEKLVERGRGIESNPLAYGKGMSSPQDYDILQYVMDSPLYQEILTRKNFYNKQSWAEFLLPKGGGLTAAECEIAKAAAEKEGREFYQDWGHPNARGNKLWFEVLSNYAEENKLW